MDSNARRIVECVNACSGMADPAAEIARLRAVESALRALINAPVAPTSEHHQLVIAARSALAGKGAK
jgi:hypothetical protein